MLILVDGMSKVLNYVIFLDGEDSPLQSVLFLGWLWRWHRVLDRALRINEIQDSGTRTACIKAHLHFSGAGFPTTNLHHLQRCMNESAC